VFIRAIRGPIFSYLSADIRVKALKNEKPGHGRALIKLSESLFCCGGLYGGHAGA
jgi:hypothetical protein